MLMDKDLNNALEVLGGCFCYVFDIQSTRSIRHSETRSMHAHIYENAKQPPSTSGATYGCHLCHPH